MGEPSIALPRWADSGSVTEPGAGKKDLGWVAGEMPPAEIMNWLHKSGYEWLQYFQQLTNGVEAASDVWRLLSTRTDGVPVLQIGVEPGEHDTPTTWKSIIDMKTGTTRSGGLYSGRDSNTVGLVLTHNAYWNATTGRWVQGDSAETSVALAFDSNFGAVRTWRAPIGAAPWITWPEVGNSENDAAVANLVLVPNSTSINYTTSFTVTKFIDARSGFVITTSVPLQTYNSDLAIGSSSAVAACVLEVPMDDTIPQGATVTRIRVIAEVSGGSAGVSLEGFRTTLSFSTPSYGAHVSMNSGGDTNSSGTGVQVLTFTPNQNATLDAGRCGRIRLRSEDNGGWFYPQIEVQYQYARPNIE